MKSLSVYLLPSFKQYLIITTYPLLAVIFEVIIVHPDSGENYPFSPYKVLQVDVCDPGIILEQEYLVHRQQSGEWLIHRCLNCNTDVYATKPRSSKLLISQNIQYDPSVIERLQKSPNYSEVFELILTEKDSPSFGIPGTSGLESLQDEINLVQEQLTNYLLQEETEMENKIKQYEEEQRNAFQLLQKKVKKDKKNMLSVLLEAQKLKSSSDNNNSSIVTRTPERSKAKSVQRSQLSRTKSTPVPRGHSLEEFDQNTDGMFMLDGLEQDTDEPFYPSDDDDFDEEVEKEAPSTVKKNKLKYSTSVPISVPKWGNRDKAELSEDEDDDSLPSDPEQIAASMQALAQSIHNDERYIFGDRPRPRLNTGDFTS